LRYAAVDIGTNSSRLLVMEIHKNGHFNPLVRRLITTRIGEGLSVTGKINMRAMKETVECLSHFREIINQYKVNASRAVATSAAREANNQNIFLEKITPYFPGPVDIISGEEEALLTYQGVTQRMKLAKSPLVIDTGGGSTEFVLKNGTNYVRSIKLGAVRATESNMGRADMEGVLADIIKEKHKFTGHPVVFVGGTATTLAAIKLKMRIYNPEIIHGQVMSRTEINELCCFLQVKIPQFCKKISPGTSGELLCKPFLYHPSFLP